MADIRKLFTLGENNSPNTSQRIVFGQSGATSENMTLLNFIAWIKSALIGFFLKAENNLSELTDVAAARTKLDVYDTGTVDTMVAHTDTGWHDGSEVNLDVEGASFICKCAQYGKIVTVNGQIKLTGDPGASIVFTLAPEVAAPSIDVYFSACDADGATSENIEFKVAAGTKNVYAVDTSQDRISSYNFTYYT